MKENKNYFFKANECKLSKRHDVVHAATNLVVKLIRLGS